MTYSEIFATTVLLFCCACATYTDVRSRKIYNWCTYGLLYVGLCAQCLWLWLGLTTVSAFLTQLIGGGILVFVLYWFNVFAAGDAKLLWGIGLAMPPSLLKTDGLTLFVVGVNSFLPYGIALGVYLAMKHRHQLRQLLQTGQAGVCSTMVRLAPLFVVFYLCYSIVLSVILQLNYHLKLRLNTTLIMVLAMGLYFPIRKAVRKQFRDELLILLLIPGFVASQILTPLPIIFLLQRLFFFFGLFVFVPVVQLLLKSTLKDVNIFHLTTDLAPVEKIIKMKTESGEENYAKVQRSELPVSGSEIIAPKGERLTEGEILGLKQLDRAGHFEHFGGSLLVQPTIVFAPALLIGTVITLICRAPIYTLWLR